MTFQLPIDTCTASNRLLKALVLLSLKFGERVVSWLSSRYFLCKVLNLSRTYWILVFFYILQITLCLECLKSQGKAFVLTFLDNVVEYWQDLPLEVWVTNEGSSDATVSISAPRYVYISLRWIYFSTRYVYMSPRWIYISPRYVSIKPKGVHTNHYSLGLAIDLLVPR